MQYNLASLIPQTCHACKHNKIIKSIQFIAIQVRALDSVEITAVIQTVRQDVYSLRTLQRRFILDVLIRLLYGVILYLCHPLGWHFLI